MKVASFRYTHPYLVLEPIYTAYVHDAIAAESIKRLLEISSKKEVVYSITEEE